MASGAGDRSSPIPTLGPAQITIAEDSVMADFPRSLNRSHEYSYRLPTPPRIIVPPPTLTNDMPELSMGLANNASQSNDLDTSFLNDMNLESIIQKNTLLEWAYERRRQAQIILPWLYLGPLSAAKDRDFLAREGITMALVIRANATSMNGAVEIARSVVQEVASIEAPNYYALIPNFSRATRMINQHLARVRQATMAESQAKGVEPQLGKVLVFCESGNEKSAAVVAAYLMEMMGNFDYVHAMQICQAQRFCVNFDDTIKTVLRSHWDILSAQRAVAGACTSTGEHSNGTSHLQVQGGGGGSAGVGGFGSNQHQKPKRTIEQTADEDMDIDLMDQSAADDALRFGGRDNTPFRDP